VFLLDRGGAPTIDGIKRIPFPTYTHTANAADSGLIQKLCSQFAIDVFASTYYTTPLTTPSVLLVYDMIPEVFGFDVSHRIWKEKALAITHAQQIICISESTKRDLHSYYPWLDASSSIVAHCGYDRAFFFPSSPEVLPTAWSRQHRQPYFLLVGSRVQHKNYKNCGLLFKALADMADIGVDVVCAGGEPDMQAEFIEQMPAGCTVSRHDFTDAELGEVYRGALALVYPSLYEGFGMPVLEAMACGCPVITTARGSLPEVAGDAAIIISGDSVEEMANALNTVREPRQRARLTAAGLRQASSFSWETFAESFVNQCVEATNTGALSTSQNFYKEWMRLRQIQGSVDVEVFVSTKS
jgi:glycosyltransferase involved in cell wall biosynthesis